MWLARRAADKIGAPYEFVMQFAQERALARLFQHFPRPNQLYGEEYEIDLAMAWFESKQRMLRYSRMPKFHVTAWRGSRIQKMHVEFVAEQIKQRPSPHTNLLARMLHEGVIPPGVATEHFEEEQVKKALCVAAKLSAQSA